MSETTQKEIHERAVALVRSAYAGSKQQLSEEVIQQVAAKIVKAMAHH